MTRPLRRIGALAAMLAAGAPASALGATPPPAVPNAAAAIVVDGRNGEVMFAKRAGEQRQIASTTKLMTALLTLERTRPKEVFTAAAYDAAPVESQIGLAPGEQMTVADLLEALLLESANDAAVTLAEGVSGTREAFVADMNARAEELGPGGHELRQPDRLRRPAQPLDRARPRGPGARAARPPPLRAGGRPPAGRARVGRAAARDRQPQHAGGGVSVRERGEDRPHARGGLRAGGLGAEARGGARVISVVMGEPSEAARDEDTLKLLRWGLARFNRVRVVFDHNSPQVTASIEHRDEKVELVPARGAVLTVREGEDVQRRVRAPDELVGPLPAGRRVGTVTVLVDGEPRRRVALVTATAVPEAGTLRVLLSELGVPLTVLLALAILLGAALMAMRLRVRFKLVRR